MSTWCHWSILYSSKILTVVLYSRLTDPRFWESGHLHNDPGRAPSALPSFLHHSLPARGALRRLLRRHPLPNINPFLDSPFCRRRLRRSSSIAVDRSWPWTTTTPPHMHTRRCLRWFVLSFADVARLRCLRARVVYRNFSFISKLFSQNFLLRETV